METALTGNQYGLLCTLEQIEGLIRDICTGKVKNFFLEDMLTASGVDQSIVVAEMAKLTPSSVQVWLDNSLPDLRREVENHGRFDLKTNLSYVPFYLRQLGIAGERYSHDSNLLYIRIWNRIKGIEWYESNAYEAFVADQLGLSTGLAVRVHAYLPTDERGVFRADFEKIYEAARPLITDPMLQLVSGNAVAGGFVYNGQSSGFPGSLLLRKSDDYMIDFALMDYDHNRDRYEIKKQWRVRDNLLFGPASPNRKPSVMFRFFGTERSVEVGPIFGEGIQSQVLEAANQLEAALKAIE